MHLDSLPKHLIIVGGSYIGLEFGQMFRRFGSEVTIIEAGPRLIGREDDDVSAAILDILGREGIQVRLGTKCKSFAKQGDEIVVSVETAGVSSEIRGSHVLLAVGRRPNTDDLGLEKAGVAVDSRGYIQVDDQLRTNVPGIWAMGDCNGKGGFTHTSYNDFEIVAANLLDNDPRRVSDRILTYALYIDPPLGRAGMTETEARASGRKVLVGMRPMTKVGRAVEKGETLGFMKVLIDADTQRIMGAAILGTGGDEAIHCILDVMYADKPYTVIQRAVHIHPTVSELIPTMLGELTAIAVIRSCLLPKTKSEAIQSCWTVWIKLARKPTSCSGSSGRILCMTVPLRSGIGLSSTSAIWKPSIGTCCGPACSRSMPD